MEKALAQIPFGAQARRHFYAYSPYWRILHPGEHALSVILVQGDA